MSRQTKFLPRPRAIDAAFCRANADEPGSAVRRGGACKAPRQHRLGCDCLRSFNARLCEWQSGKCARERSRQSEHRSFAPRSFTARWSGDESHATLRQASPDVPPDAPGKPGTLGKFWRSLPDSRAPYHAPAYARSHASTIHARRAPSRRQSRRSSGGRTPRSCTCDAE